MKNGLRDDAIHPTPSYIGLQSTQAVAECDFSAVWGNEGKEQKRLEKGISLGRRPSGSPSPGQRPVEGGAARMFFGPTGQPFREANHWPVGPTSRSRSPAHQGVALAWVNGCPLGATHQRLTCNIFGIRTCLKNLPSPLGRRPSGSPSPGQRPVEDGRRGGFSAQRANHSARRTIGPLGRRAVHALPHTRALPWPGRTAAPLGQHINA